MSSFNCLTFFSETIALTVYCYETGTINHIYQIYIFFVFIYRKTQWQYGLFIYLWSHIGVLGPWSVQHQISIANICLSLLLHISNVLCPFVRTKTKPPFIFSTGFTCYSLQLISLFVVASVSNSYNFLVILMTILYNSLECV